jgi:Phage portal protein, SPP1 Gp6-like.
VSDGCRLTLKRPLRATLYEEDGFTEYIWNERIEDGKRITEGQVYKPKRPYKIERAEKGSIDEGEIYNGENYPAFPIVPFFANEHKQSAIVGMREHIDAYDLNKNGYANELDNAIVYWVLKGAAGFDDVEATAFVQKIKALGVANTESDQDVQAIPVNPPIDGRERLLDRIEKDIYKDFGALDIDQVKSGAVTATQIKAAYEALDMAANQFEYQILEFLDRLMIVAGVKDTATFTRATLVNSTESLQMLLQAAPFLTEDYVITKALELFGDGDKADYIINQRKAEELNRFGIGTDEEEEADQKQEQKIEAEE